jgi:hypothetical protein
MQVAECTGCSVAHYCCPECGANAAADHAAICHLLSQAKQVSFILLILFYSGSIYLRIYAADKQALAASL